MSRTENEQEFVLGNKQLLSAFFVVVLLLGVFFAMGYIVGSNTGPNSSARKTVQAEPAPVTASAPARDSASAPPPVQPAVQQDPAPTHTEPVKTSRVDKAETPPA